MVPLPKHLFELDGELTIKPSADTDMVESYLKDLERYQELVEIKDQSGADLDSAFDEQEF